MPDVVFALIALAGAAIHVWRHKGSDKPAFAIDTFLVWWFVLPIGIGGIFGAAFHLFDGPDIAREIGYTRGNGGFQYWLVEDDTQPDNVGATLAMDVISPIVAIALYALSWQRGGDARPEPAVLQRA